MRDYTYGGGMEYFSVKYLRLFSSALNTAVTKATNMCEFIRTCVLIQLISSEPT